jgi:hypothetical protein
MGAAVNRDAKTQTALIALARTRRVQRALAHAYIHRDAPLPTLRHSLGFMTSTACTSEERAGLGHSMQLLGLARNEGVAYVVEELGSADAPIIYRLWLRGPRQGHLVPIHAWYEQCENPAEIRARIAAIAKTLEPAPRTTTEAWMLSTRVVQRRALRVAGGGAPIRKFALQLRVEPVSGHGASGHTTVTAFLRPGATLAEVWALEPGVAAARVTYTGVPNGLGLPKDTIVLLTE